MLKIVVSISDAPEQQMFMQQLIDEALDAGGLSTYVRVVTTHTSKSLELDIDLFISLAKKILANPQNHKAFFFGNPTFHEELKNDLITLIEVNGYVQTVTVEHIMGRKT